MDVRCNLNIKHDKLLGNPIGKNIENQLMDLLEIINSLFKQGLGELFILHTMKGKIFLGKVSYDKGRLVIKDQGFLSLLESDQLLNCWENGIIGAVCYSEKQEWKGLSFCGLDQCDISKEDLLSKTAHGGLIAAENEYGESLIDFFGSVYRGYKLLMDNHFLPVILMMKIPIKNGGFGLAVSTLRAAPISISIINDVHNAVMATVEKHLTLDVDDVKIDQEQFSKLFGDFIPGD